MVLPIVVSSPLRGNYTQNLNKAAELCKDLIKYNYAPLATHLFYMRAKLLNDRIETHRLRGILDTQVWIRTAGRVIFLLNEKGELSEGCEKELETAKKYCIPYVILPWDYSQEELEKKLIELDTIIDQWAA